MSNEVDEPPNQTASDQADIIDVLQIENEALRSQLGKLETTLERIELRQTQQFSGTFQDASSPVRKRSNNNNDTNTSYDSPSPFSPNKNNKSNSNLPPITMNNLEEMMVKIQLAKNDAILHGESSREKLMNDITFLHDLLKQAKVEQTSNLTEIAQLKKQVKSQKVTCDKIMKRREQDKMIFVEMLKRERTQFETKFSEAELKVRWFEQEMRKVTGWAKQRHLDFVTASQHMQVMVNDAQRETVEQANSFNLDLASELESLRSEVADQYSH